MRVHFTEEAERDLEAIGDYIASDNPERAITFVMELRDACLGLARMPKRFPLAAGFEDRQVRRRGYGSYLIFYRIEANKIDVLHVLYGAQDWGRILELG